MATESIFVLTLILLAFCVFAGAIAWADGQTRELNRH
jgi:hypothetical protein